MPGKAGGDEQKGAGEEDGVRAGRVAAQRRLSDSSRALWSDMTCVEND